MKNTPKPVLTLLAIGICLISGVSAGSDPNAQIIASVPLNAASDSEVLLTRMTLEYLSNGSERISGVVQPPEEPSSGFLLAVSVDADSLTYSAKFELVDSLWFEQEDTTLHNLLPVPEEGCPVQICHREVRVGGRHNTEIGQVENITRVDIDYAYHLETAEITLLDYLQKCVPNRNWLLEQCNKLAPTTTAGSASVATEGRYRGAYVAIGMATSASITVANGVQLIAVTYNDWGTASEYYDMALIVSPLSCRTVLQ